MSPVSDLHAIVHKFLVKIFDEYFEITGLGTIRFQPFLMKLGVDRFRSPDILVVKLENATRILSGYLDGPVDLIVEIVSPGSIGQDRGDKYVECAEAGVPEYWLIDPIRQRAEFYGLAKDGQYELLTWTNDRFDSKVFPGLWIKPSWFWKDKKPTGRDVVKLWGLP